MTICNLTLEVLAPAPNAPEVAAAEGPTLRARVHVEAQGPLTCDSLRLELGWRTHGRGDREEGVAWTRSLFSGDWSKGETASFEYEAPMPAPAQGMPASYHGEHFNLDWHLTATVHEGSAAVATREQRIFVASPAPRRAREKGPERSPENGQEWTAEEPVAMETLHWDRGRRLAWVPGAALAAAGVFVGLRVPLFGGPLLLAGIVLTRRAFRRAEAAFRWKKAEAGHAPAHVQPGGPLTLRLLIPEDAVEGTTECTWTLTATEKATTTTGTIATHFTRTAFVQSLDAGEGARPLNSEEREGGLGGRQVDTVFQIPADAPAALELQNHSVRWEARLQVRQGRGAAISSRRPFPHPA